MKAQLQKIADEAPSLQKQLKEKKYEMSEIAVGMACLK